MTQSTNSSLTQLVEVFPSWTKEDLSTVLNEAGGDVYVAISRISEGHVSQWSDSTKKATINSGFESRPTRPERLDRGNRNHGNGNNDKKNNANSRFVQPHREPRERASQNSKKTDFGSDSGKKLAAVAKSSDIPSENNLSWGEKEKRNVVSQNVSDKSITATRTSFAAAAASAVSEKEPIKKDQVPKPKTSKKPSTLVSLENGPIESSENSESNSKPVELEVTTSETITDVAVPVTAIPVVIENVSTVESANEEEEEIVSMPSRSTPSLTMEQPAVILPIRTNLRANLSVRFGYDSSAAEAVLVEKSTVVEAVQPVKTPITVSALESTFAMMSAPSPAPAKSPEPIGLSGPTAADVSSWDHSRSTNTATIPDASSAYNNGTNTSSSTASSSAGYGSYPRNGRPHGGWDYEIANSTNVPITVASSASNFGPAPGFSGPTSPVATAPPQRFVSRAAAQYDNSPAYNTAPPASNSRFSPYEESPAVGNNVSQYYTTRAAPQPTSGYSNYRGGNSFNNNAARYNPSTRPYYQQQQHYSPAPPNHQQQSQVQSQQQSSSASGTHYSPYNQHQNYLNSYHHGYPQYPEHVDQYSQQPQQSQQPYYQPYQPPNQYLSNSNMHHHHHNQHHNA